MAPLSLDESTPLILREAQMGCVSLAAKTKRKRARLKSHEPSEVLSSPPLFGDHSALFGRLFRDEQMSRGYLFYHTTTNKRANARFPCTQLLIWLNKSAWTSCPQGRTAVFSGKWRPMASHDIPRLLAQAQAQAVKKVKRSESHLGQKAASNLASICLRICFMFPCWF